MSCDDCSYARVERDPYTTGDQDYVEYYCTAPRCVEEEQSVAYWPDGTWADLEEVERGSYNHMSDDYTVVSLPGDMDDESIDEYVRQVRV